MKLRCMCDVCQLVSCLDPTWILTPQIYIQLCEAEMQSTSQTKQAHCTFGFQIIITKIHLNFNCSNFTKFVENSAANFACPSIKFAKFSDLQFSQIGNLPDSLQGAPCNSCCSEPTSSAEPSSETACFRADSQSWWYLLSAYLVSNSLQHSITLSNP